MIRTHVRPFTLSTLRVTATYYQERKHEVRFGSNLGHAQKSSHISLFISPELAIVARRRSLAFFCSSSNTHMDGRHTSAKHSRTSTNSTQLAAGLADIVKGDADILGWKVIVQDSGKLIGKVVEVLWSDPVEDDDEVGECAVRVVGREELPAAANAPTAHGMRAVKQNAKVDRPTQMEYMLPLVEPIVVSLNTKSRTLNIDPPKGLLELARTPQLLAALAPAIKEFSRANCPRRGTMLAMPTRQQLLSAGCHDLISGIMAGGGFLTVAHQLGLRASRRPVGFWEDPSNLDLEIERFVASSWSLAHNSASGQAVYRNTVTGELRKTRPRSAANLMDPVPASGVEGDVATAVMPRVASVIHAGRFDLHHAIIFRGGYREVARELGRQPPPSRSHELHESAEKVLAFMDDRGLVDLPSGRELRAAGTDEISRAIHTLGGPAAAARALGVRSRRSKRRRWDDIGDAELALRRYLWYRRSGAEPPCGDESAYGGDVYRCSEEEEEEGYRDEDNWRAEVKRGAITMPTRQQLKQEGRFDIYYILQKHGGRELAQRLQVPSSKRGRKRLRVP